MFKEFVDLAKREPVILIVDDTPQNIKLLHSVLRDYSCKILMAQSGSRALEIVHKSKPDIILLDIMMPGMDGFEVCDTLKKNPETSEIPVVYLTARSDSDGISKAFEFGGVDYITKPFNPKELVLRLNIHLNLFAHKIALKNKVQEKADLIGILAHDLKNPLSCMISLITMSKTANEEKRAKYYEMIDVAGTHMTEILKDTLESEALDSHKITLKSESVDASEILSRVIDINQLSAKNKKIKINKRVCFEHRSISTDPSKLLEVMDNLISNAIKYSPEEKEVWVDLSSEDDYLKLSVKDEGLGLNKSDMGMLFQRFQKLSSLPTGNESSTGLGLYNVKKIVELMGGEISAKSKGKNKGSTFSVKFPITNKAE